MSALAPVLHDVSQVYPLVDHFNSIPKEKYSPCVAKVRHIAQVLSTFSGPSASLNGRVNYIGQKLLEELATAAAGHELSAIEIILCELFNYKNALQVEAVYYGAISHMLDTYLTISKLPFLRELWHEMPFIFRNITHDQTMVHCFRINLKPLDDYFAKLDLDSLPDTFDTTMLQIFQMYPIEGDELIVPIGSLPPFEILDTYIESQDFHSKLMAQMLLYCKIEEILILDKYTSKFLSKGLLKSLRHQPFDFYIPKKPLVPLLGHFIEKSESLKASGNDAIDMLFDETFLNQDHDLKGADWLEESALVFDLIKKIEFGVRRVFKPGFLAPLDERFVKEACDKKVLSWIQVFHEMAVFNHFPISYPISKPAPFAKDKLNFKLLCFSHFMKSNMELIEEQARVIREKEIKKALKAHAGKKGKKEQAIAIHVVEAPVAKCGAGGASSASTLGALGIVEEDEDFDFSTFVHLKKATKTAKAGASVSKPEPSELEASLHKASTILDTFQFHKRIKVWQRSKEHGLEYYQFGHDGVAHELTQEEMVLRHRLPKDLLVLSLNPHYGIKKPITLASGEVIDNHYESCLLIDGKKYILETSVNSKNIVFHFYARRVQHIHDYQQMMSFAPSEYPTIKSIAQGSSALGDEGKEFEGIDVSRLIFDKDGNVSCDYEGHTYQVALLKPFA